MRSSFTPLRWIAMLATFAFLAVPHPATSSNDPTSDASVVGTSLPLEAPLLGLDATATMLGDATSRPALIFFFSTSCPHCWNVASEFQTLCEQLAPIGCMAIAKSSSPIEQVRAFAETAGIRCGVYVDLTGQFATSLGLEATPTTLLVDADGQIAFTANPFYRGASFTIERAVARGSGQDEKALWQPDRYYGSRTCGECHPVAYDSWRLTPHTLATVHLPAGHDETCLRCHATAAGQPAGYTSKASTGHLRGVGCEACHGAAGGHQADGSVNPEIPAAESCAVCHDAAHSMSQDFKAMRATIDHHLAEGLSEEAADEHRYAMIRKELPRPGLQPAAGICVGSLACGLCHAEIYDSWVTGLHGPGHAKSTTDTSLPCAPSASGSVECEQCHGAGGAHLAGGDGGGPLPGLRGEHARECVVEPTCRRCHSRDADPDWFLPQETEGIHAPRTD